MVTWEDKIFYQMMLRKGGNNNKRRNLWKTFTDVLKFTKGIQEPGKRADILARVLRKKEKGSKKKKKNSAETADTEVCTFIAAMAYDRAEWQSWIQAQDINYQGLHGRWCLW